MPHRSGADKDRQRQPQRPRADAVLPVAARRVHAVPVSALPTREMRGELDRINAKPEAARTPRTGLRSPRSTCPTPASSCAGGCRSRRGGFRDRRAEGAARFVDAMVAGAEKRYEDAARLFAAAAPRLDPRGGPLRSMAAIIRARWPIRHASRRHPAASGGGPYGGDRRSLHRRLPDRPQGSDRR